MSEFCAAKWYHRAPVSDPFVDTVNAEYARAPAYYLWRATVALIDAALESGGLMVPHATNARPMADAVARLVGAGAAVPAGKVVVAPDSDPDGAYQPGRAYPAWFVANPEAAGRVVDELTKAVTGA